MHAELPAAGVDAERPLSILRRRAALVSVAGHGALFALLTFVGTRTELPSFESPLIVGELVTTSLDPAATPEEPPAAPVAESAEEPAPTPPAEPQTADLEPPPAEQPEAERQPEPLRTAPERTVEAPLEPPPVETLAELPPPDVEPVAEAPQAPEPLVSEGLPATEAPAEVAEEPVRSLASHEERSVRKRLSSWTGRLGVEAPGTTLAWHDAGQDYTAVLKHVPATDAMGMEQLLVELTTQRDGERLVAALRMNRIAFSNFAQFIDRWDPDVQIHDDLIDGRFHSTTEIRVSRERGVQPVFNGKVTVAGGDVRADGTGFMNRRTMFPEGIETRVRRIVLPSRAAAFDDRAVPVDRLRRIVRDSLLTFHADGTFESHALEDGGASEAAAPAADRDAVGDEPFYIVAGDGVDLHVRGTVNGKVLVY